LKYLEIDDEVSACPPPAVAQCNTMQRTMYEDAVSACHLHVQDLSPPTPFLSVYHPPPSSLPAVLVFLKKVKYHIFPNDIYLEI